MNAQRPLRFLLLLVSYLNGWRLSGDIIARPNVQIWAFMPEPAFSRGIEFWEWPVGDENGMAAFNRERTVPDNSAG